MKTFTQVLSWSAVLATVDAHGVILGAQGPAGPSSFGFKVDPAIARNCTTISPCQQDATLIRTAEIEANIVNECGRTELAGNIDIGEETENAIAAGAVTQVTKGSSIEVMVHQVNADGAGPYVCDLDMTSNGKRLVGQVPLVVENNVPGVNGFSQAKAQNFNMTVKLPDDLACIGASTGNVCTVRCRNAALAGPFGGCFPIQQTDVEPTINDPATINSAQDIDLTLAQTANNQKDLPKAIEANANAGSDSAKQNLAAVEALLQNKPTTVAFPQVTLPLPTVANPTPTADAGNGNNGNGDNGNGNQGNNNGNGNQRDGGNANGNNGNPNQDNNGNGNGNGNENQRNGGNGNGNNGNQNQRNGGNGNGNGNGNNGNGAQGGFTGGPNNGNGNGGFGQRNTRRDRTHAPSLTLRWAKRVAGIKE
ncbi:hypothetical protein LIA77_11563 [Sarocladium implicatum]|nr:hypothetical protein LIA77_11563 [Sarocladium implicatum]